MTKIYFNGEITDMDSASVKVNDTGLLFGSGLFETMRAENGRVFRIDDHLERLFGSAEKLMINIHYKPEQLKAAVEETLEANALEKARVRLTYTTGNVREHNKIQPTLMITAVEYTGYPAVYYKDGVKILLSDFRQCRNDPLAGHKTTSYYSRILALNLAHQKGCAEAVWFSSDNKLAEGSVSNIFIVKDGRLLTPPVDTPVLPGIMRKTVLEAAAQAEIETEQKHLYINDLLSADEVFMTNVIMTVLPVVAVEAHTVNKGEVGPVTRKLHKEVAGILSAFSEQQECS